jgi:hypothetical protein
MTHEGYKVGYKKPPRNRQFKPGQSGNPRGRPSATSSFQSDLTAELRKHTVLIEDGRRRTVSKQRAFISSLISSALENDKTAINTLLACLRYFGAGNDEPGGETSTLEDVEMIENYLARNKRQIAEEKTVKAPDSTKNGK